MSHNGLDDVVVNDKEQIVKRSEFCGAVCIFDKSLQIRGFSIFRCEFCGAVCLFDESLQIRGVHSWRAVGGWGFNFGGQVQDDAVAPVVWGTTAVREVLSWSRCGWVCSSLSGMMLTKPALTWCWMSSHTSLALSAQARWCVDL